MDKIGDWLRSRGDEWHVTNGTVDGGVWQMTDIRDVTDSLTDGNPYCEETDVFVNVSEGIWLVIDIIEGWNVLLEEGN